MYPRERSFWGYKVYADIRGGYLGTGLQMRVWSLKMAIFAFFVHGLPNILHTWPHDSFHMISRSLDCFTLSFSITVRDTAKFTSLL